jgi:tRNA (guanine-N7-)-methyltransferase
VGKNKITRWAELETFGNVIQHTSSDEFGRQHPLKGRWRKEIFRNSNPVILELGCGRGEYTTGLAERYPGNNYIGVDIKGARMWRGAKTATENKLFNASFLRTRIEFIDNYFDEDEVDAIWITFPDPHPGKGNANKRLTCPWFINKYRSFLKHNGIIHLKTDNYELYRYSRRIVESNNLQILVSVTDLHKELEGNEILKIKTHYEELFLSRGLKINYLSFLLEKNKIIEKAP